MFVVHLVDQSGASSRVIYDPQRSFLVHEDGQRVDLAPVGHSYSQGQWAAYNPVSPQTPGRKVRKLRQINIQLGLKCNYECGYCMQRFQPHSDEGRVADVEQFLATLGNWFDGDENSEVEFRYWGGEPFLYWKKLQPLAEALKQRFPRSRHVIYTNGTLLTVEKNDWLENLGATVVISHDGPGQNVRGADPFDDPRKAATIIDLYDRLADKGQISFNVVLTAQNHDLDEIKEWFEERLPGRKIHLNINNIVIPYHKDGISVSLRGEEVQHEVMMSMYRSIVSGDGSTYLTVRRKLDDFYLSLATARPASTVGQKCGLDRPYQIAVTLKGDVLTCHNVSPTASMPDGRSHRIGSTNDLDAVALNTGTHWSLRDKCRTCPVVQLCKGSCMYLEGDDFEQACANEFAYNMALFMVGITSLTGCVPVYIEKIEPSKE